VPLVSFETTQHHGGHLVYCSTKVALLAVGQHHYDLGNVAGVDVLQLYFLASVFHLSVDTAGHSRSVSVGVEGFVRGKV